MPILILLTEYKNILEEKFMRKHYFDNGRAIASFLGIVYHSALVFNGTAWLISTDEQRALPILQIYTDYINLFRMPLFLFIAGYFGAYSVKKYNFNEFTLNKLTRLGIPLISTLLSFNILEKLYTYRFNHGTYPSMTEVLSTLLPWSSDFQLSHLWFLYYVIIFSFLIYISSFFKTYHIGTLIKRRLDKYMDVILIACNIGILGIFGVLFVITDLFHELFSFLAIGVNLPYFLLGVLTYQNWSYFKKKFLDLSRTRIIVFSTLLITSYMLADMISNLVPNTNTILNTFPRYFSLVLVLGLLYKYLNKSNRFLKYMSESSYSVYLIHQPIIVVISYYYIEYINDLNPLIGYFTVFLLSTSIIYLLDFILIRNTKWGTFLFKGKINSERIKEIKNEMSA
jgi:glucans biosynthesis protein C